MYVCFRVQACRVVRGLPYDAHTICGTLNRLGRDNVYAWHTILYLVTVVYMMREYLVSISLIQFELPTYFPGIGVVGNTPANPASTRTMRTQRPVC